MRSENCLRSLTFRPRFHIYSFHNIEPFQLAHDTPILLINKHDMSMLLAACSTHIPFAWREGAWIILALPTLPLRRLRPLQESGTLRKNSLKSIEVLLRHLPRPRSNARKLDARESARLGSQVPARNEVARRRLVVDLCCGGEGNVKFWRKM